VGWGIAWFAIYTVVECFVLILQGSVQEMVGLLLNCEFEVMMIAVGVGAQVLWNCMGELGLLLM